MTEEFIPTTEYPVPRFCSTHGIALEYKETPHSLHRYNTYTGIPYQIVRREYRCPIQHNSYSDGDFYFVSLQDRIEDVPVL